MRLFKYFFVKEKLFHFFSCFILTLRKIKKDFIFISWFYVSCEFEHSLKPFIPYYSRKLFCLVNSFLNEKQLRECVHSNHVLIDAPSLIKFYYLDEKVRFYLPLIIAFLYPCVDTKWHTWFRKNVSHFIKAIENSKNVRHDQCSQCTFDRQTVRYTYEYHKHCSG